SPQPGRARSSAPAPPGRRRRPPRTPGTAIASLAALAVLVVLLQAGFLRARLRVEVDRGGGGRW
ncbi:hypothetical protein NWP10_12220, partial [Micrococcus sp. HG099]|uniref:hypothetical protein n=1 Tax=Micrococcus sp. HG099 TaxID=2969755 RepID=UPI00215B50C5